MDKSTSSNIKLGIFVCTAVILFALGVYYIGNRQNLFGENFRISSVFQNVNGLQKGNSVRYAGIDVGTVDDIRIINDSTIRVVMLLEKEVQNFLKKDAIANIGTDGLVGNMIINITPGSGDLSTVEEGDQIQSYTRIDPEDMLNTLGNTTENIALLTLNLLEIAENINEGQGALPMMINDASIANDLRMTANNLKRTSQNMTSISKKLQTATEHIVEGDGLLSFLLNDTMFEDKIMAISSNLDTLVRFRTEPILNQLEQSSSNITMASKELNQIVRQIDLDKGLARTILKDTVISDQFKEIIGNLREGTILLNQNMEAMKSNFLFRGYYKKQERKKRKEDKPTS